ncbi:hypothetical protein [Micromonospora sp. CB01531]|uniref:hypothetical protein n=1 Tax=Micromonospora sp. CB01531 TaxID=1718947 RepID=UPI000B268C8A|nr:hypothetical protein [Micromonospora sp. CB01531]
MLFAVPWIDRDRMIEDPTPIPANRYFDITAEFAAGFARLGPADLPPSVIARYGPAYAPLQLQRLDDQEAFVAALLAELFTPRRVTYLELADYAVPPPLAALLAVEPDALIALCWSDLGSTSHPESLLRGPAPLVTHRSRLVRPEPDPEYLRGEHRSGPMT